MKNKLNILLGTLFLLIFNTFVFAEDWGGDGTGITVPVPPEGLGSPATPIDMYEGALMMIAIVLIVGYYVYHRNKKIKHI